MVRSRRFESLASNKVQVLDRGADGVLTEIILQDTQRMTEVLKFLSNVKRENIISVVHPTESVTIVYYQAETTTPV